MLNEEINKTFYVPTGWGSSIKLTGNGKRYLPPFDLEYIWKATCDVSDSIYFKAVKEKIENANNIASLYNSIVRAIQRLEYLEANPHTDWCGFCLIDQDRIITSYSPNNVGDVDKKHNKIVFYDNKEGIWAGNGAEDHYYNSGAFAFACVAYEFITARDNEFMNSYKEYKMETSRIKKASAMSKICDNIYRRTRYYNEIRDYAKSKSAETDIPIFNFDSLNLENGTLPEFDDESILNILKQSNDKSICCGCIDVKAARKYGQKEITSSLEEKDELFGKWAEKKGYIVRDEDRKLIVQLSNSSCINPEIHKLYNHFVNGNTSVINIIRGVAGAGKSTAVKQFAAMLGLPYRVQSISDGTDELDLLQHVVVSGKDDKVGYSIIDSPIVKTFRYGGVCEIAEPTVARNQGIFVGLNAMFDDSAVLTLTTGEVVSRNPFAYFIYTTNIGYEGTHNMNQSVIDRCDKTIVLETPEKIESIKRIMQQIKSFGNIPISEELVGDMYDLVKEIENTCQENGADDGALGFRRLKSWVKNYSFSGDIYGECITSVIESATVDPDIKARLYNILDRKYGRLKPNKMEV